VVKTRDEALRVVREFRARLAEIYGARLRGVYLFGSFARGEATEDSDIDVAVVLAGTLNPYRESERTSAIFGELSQREHCLLVPFFLSEGEYEAQQSAVDRSIAAEGVPV